MGRSKWLFILLLGTALLLLAGACAPGAAPEEEATEAPPAAEPPPAEEAGAVTVFSLWGGSERDAFQAVLFGFTEATGIVARYEQGRDFEAVLRPRVAAGNPPDVAIVPRPGAMAAFAREGAIVPLDDIVGDLVNENYSQAWIDLGTVDGQLYGIAAKANSKTTIWYRPDLFGENGWEIPETWDDLLALNQTIREGADVAPFAFGAKDAWTLTDWWETITLRGFGPELYDQIVNHEIAWTDPRVKATFETFGQIIRPEENIAGGVDGALGTGFVDGIAKVFSPDPEAAMYYEGGFVGGIATGDVNPELVIGETIDFFGFPVIDEPYAQAVMGAGDLASAFRDTPEVREFLKYLASPEAGEIWAATGAIVSPNKNVDLSVYPNELSAKEAEQLGQAEIFRFDGSDLMPSGIGGDQLFIALQNFLADPDSLDTILEDLEARAKLEY